MHSHNAILRWVGFLRCVRDNCEANNGDNLLDEINAQTVTQTIQYLHYFYELHENHRLLKTESIRQLGYMEKISVFIVGLLNWLARDYHISRLIYNFDEE